MLEAQDNKNAEKPVSSSHRLVAALRDQIKVEDEVNSLSPWFDRWKATLEPQKRKATVAIVLVLLMSSLAFGLGFALQVNQTERPGFSLSERIGTLFVARRAAAPAAGQGAASASVNSLATYGAGFGWADRFNSVEVLRETASSKVLWPLSTSISMLILAILLLPQPDHTPQKPSAD